MKTFDMVLLYVQDVAESVRFYAQLLGQPPVRAAERFALFVLPGGAKIGLWWRGEIEPAANGAPGAGEIAFSVPDQAAVEAAHADWDGRGWAILQKPTAMGFGFTCTTADPDGHRVRVFAPSQR